SSYQTGWKNLMDIAVINFYEEHQCKTRFKNVTKIDEIPFDFSRRRLTVVVNADDHQLMITKRAVEEMEEVCTHAQINGEIVPLSSGVREELRRV
ncbi:magnesium-translocating P-type ATPase, partial [Enterococcus faecalis]